MEPSLCVCLHGHFCQRLIQQASRLVDVVLAVLRGYALEGEDAIHGARIVRAALHGFTALEAGEGFGLPLALDESFARLVRTLDRGLGASASA